MPQISQTIDCLLDGVPAGGPVAGTGHSRAVPNPTPLRDTPFSNLDADQQAAVEAPLGPLAILAGPGSGKTHTLVARMAHLAANGIDPAHMAALTHTQKAAGELRGRLGAVGLGAVTCSTIHALAWRQLRAHWMAIHPGSVPELLANPWGWVRDASVAERGAAQVDVAVVGEVLGEIEWARAQRLSPRQYAAAARKAGRSVTVPGPELTAIWRRYRERKTRAGVVDFGDVLELAAGLYDNPELAALLRAELTTFCCDEYQDVDPAQQHLLEVWLGPTGTFTVVGDPAQSIYLFKGAEPSLLTGFAGRWPGATIVELTVNYRSTAPIVTWVNRLADERRPLVSACGAGAAPELIVCGTEADEERALVAAIRRWRSAGILASEIAVLYRFNAAATRLEAALAGAGIGYHVSGAARFFDRPEVRGVLIPFGQAARATPMVDGPALLVATAVAQGHDRSLPPAGMGAVRQRWEAVEALCEIAAPLAGWEAIALLTELQARARAAQEPAADGVCLATVHAAKGREWDAVWVCGVAEGQFPSAYAKTGPQLREERNLAYVAVSRARSELVLSYARRRQNGWRQEPSRYLALLGHQVEGDLRPSRRSGAGDLAGGRSERPSRAVSSARPEPVRKRPACRKCGSELSSAAQRRVDLCGAACLDGELAARLAILRAWRADRAVALSVPILQVASERALFVLTVCGSDTPVPGLHPKAGRLPE